jgi:asparagine synthase (glutamine-hydrolysing)
MCGIAGILYLDGRPVTEPELEAFTRSLQHRGPDGEGLHLDGPLGLGHRRLAILDLSESGKQPMSCLDGRYWVTYNGEIYNFIELRRELEQLGYRFRTESDTEVIAAAYDRWGPDCQLRFNGMWAFALWDMGKQTLFLSRDRFGIKPLLYLSEPSRFAFASELKAFRRLSNFTPRENEHSVRRMLTHAWALEETEETLLQGVKRLQAGHCLSVNRQGLRVGRWWRTLDHLPKPPKTLAEQAEQFRELFLDSCRLRLRSDVPIATCLSGGLDSSSVLCSLAALTNGNNGHGAERRSRDYQRAFVATFAGTAWDEQAFAEAAIRRAHAEPRLRPMSAELALADLERFLFDMEEIDCDLHIPLWLLYRELRRDGVVVSLDGHGADEMLAGYLHDLDALLGASGNFLRLPLQTASWIGTRYHMSGPTSQTTPSLVSLVIRSDPLLRMASRLAGKVRRRTRQLLTGEGMDGPSGHNRANGFLNVASSNGTPSGNGTILDRDEDKAIDSLGPLTARLYRVFHSTTLPTILRNFDRCSMSHGIEVRMPFMDWRLVCFVFSLPDKSKIGGGYTKRVLREAMRGILPEEVRTRRNKIGFNSPLPNWLQGPLRDWVWKECNDPAFLDNPTWNGPAIREFVAKHFESGRWTPGECRRVWGFLNAHIWRRSFLKT